MNGLLSLIAVLSATVLSVAILRRLGLGTVLGFLIAGIIVGPIGFDLIQHTHTVEMLGEFGLLFLLFIIGLDFRLSRLKEMRRALWGLGSAEFFIVGGIFLSIGLTIGLTVEQALLVGFSLALSSTAMDLQLLTEREELATSFGRATLGTLLFQDLMAIPLLAFLPLLADSGHSVSFDVGQAFLEAIILIGFVFIFAKRIAPFILKTIAKIKSPEAFTVASIVLVLVMCAATSAAGLPMSLGAFAAGMMLAESNYRHQIQTDIMPFKALLLGLFFVVLGSTLNLRLLIAHPSYIIAAVSGLIALKLVLIFLISKGIMNLRTKESFKTALLLAQGGEFALVVFQLALVKFKILPPEIGQGLMLVILVSMTLTPILCKLAELLEKNGRLFPHKMDSVPNGELAVSDHVIIGGFGRVGQTIAYMLEKAKIPYTAIDMEPDRVVEGRNMGYPVYYGDVTRYDVLRTIGADRANIAVIALDKVSVVKQTVNSIAENFPHIKIFARARNHFESEALKKHGVTATMPETIESSLQLGRVVLDAVGVEKERIFGLIGDLRLDDYAELYKIIEASQSPQKLALTPKARNKKIHAALARMFKKADVPVELVENKDKKPPKPKKMIKKATKKVVKKKK
ncbi:MAG: cation:proton antiporter [Alphaproteobacteria bacterium]|nr:cation:proton antiporter [Alphaproteobacteria bacterium]MBN2779928.1 cation:proton antiporter [Alphaproteobacteria bacterium]